MIIKEGPPSLGRWFSVPDHALGNGGLGDLDAEDLEFAVHARRAPQGIFPGQAAYQSAHLRRHPWSAAPGSSRLPCPIEPKSLPLPTHQSIRLEDGEGLQTAGPDTIELNPEETLSQTRTEPLVVSVGDHGQLLAESDVLEMEQGAASEQAVQGSEQGEEDSLHPSDATVRWQEKST